jgi:LysM repeat protein
MEASRLKFTGVINTWVQNNWGKPFEDQHQRVVVIGRNFYENPANTAIIKAKGFVPDNHYEECGGVTAEGIQLVGDIPQSQVEADQDLGRFWIDIETSVKITYASKKVQGQVVRTFKWSAVMYVGDVLGAQPGDRADMFNKIPLVGPMAPSRTIRRAEWTIHGEGVSDADLAAATAAPPINTYTIAPGDTLSKLAEKYYGDAKWYPILYAANQQTIGSDPNKLRVGDTLRIPDLDDLSQAEKDRAMKSVSPGNDNSIPVAPLQ